MLWGDGSELGNPAMGNSCCPPREEVEEKRPPATTEACRASWALQLLLLKSGQGLWSSSAHLQSELLKHVALSP